MLYKKEIVNNASAILGIWKVEETKEELVSMLGSALDLSQILSIKSASRILERLATLVLLKQLTGEAKQIEHYDSGQPHLTDGSFNISVSHSKIYVAVILSKDRKVAIDIEQISEKIRRVRDRVISEQEYIDPNNELVHLLLHWSAKEALCKLTNRTDAHFLNHFFIQPFQPLQSGTFLAKQTITELDQELEAHYQVENDFVLVYILSHQEPKK